MTRRIHFRSKYAYKKFPACGVYEGSALRCRIMSDQLVKVTCLRCLHQVEKDDVAAGLKAPPSKIVSPTAGGGFLRRFNMFKQKEKGVPP